MGTLGTTPILSTKSVDNSMSSRLLTNPHLEVSNTSQAQTFITFFPCGPPAVFFIFDCYHQLLNCSSQKPGGHLWCLSLITPNQVIVESCSFYLPNLPVSVAPLHLTILTWIQLLSSFICTILYWLSLFHILYILCIHPSSLFFFKWKSEHIYSILQMIQ